MKFKHLIVGAGMTAFSILALAAPEAATPPAGSVAVTATAAATTPAATPKAEARAAKKAKPSEKGKTRGLKSKKGKECVSENGCESGN